MIALVMMKMSLISMSTFVVDRVCKYTPNREDRFCKRHKYLETKWLQERLDVSAENLKVLCRTCDLCNEHGHLTIRCKLFHFIRPYN